MNPETRRKLEQIRDTAPGAYAQTAAGLLDGTLTWLQGEIDQFIDGFVNDPYLTRND
ncbi:hypothetical protein [Leucobacter sp. W1153]|uniref:hypothetical protein n=1 Tax=unclassified Leucobacter TaxID=2621730 RepID=UPI003F3FFF8D